MDVTEKVGLVSRPPTEEVVTQDELLELFKTNSKPKHYIGIEISGFLHLGSLISTGFKINDFVKAGVDCTVSASMSGVCPLKIICEVISAFNIVKVHNTSYKQIIVNPTNIS